MSDERIPREACSFAASEVNISTNGEGAKTAPVELVARSAQPIDHAYWGRVVHDTSGFSVGARGRIPIDYEHDEVIGFANHFELNEHKDLVIRGTLTPGKMQEDRALDVIEKARLGVPYEASVNFGGTGIEVERVKPDETTEVNGYVFEGPGVVIRKWPLRGVAICAYGADQFTSAAFNQGDTVAVTYLEQGMKSLAEIEQAIERKVVLNQTVESEASPVEDAVEEEAEVDTVESVEEAEVQVAPEAVATADVDTELSQRKATGGQFMKLFGQEQGAVYFASGMSLQQATEAHLLHQATEISNLKKRLGAAKNAGGEETALSGTAPKAKKKPLAIADPF